MKIYHNPRCTKRRCALDWLTEQNVDFEVVDYIKNPIDENELKFILKKLNLSPSELMRKNEIEYKTYVSGKELNDDELVNLMVKFPKMIQRPIILNGDKGVIARPLENLIELMQKQQ